jgi:hypothetical protein
MERAVDHLKSYGKEIEKAKDATDKLADENPQAAQQIAGKTLKDLLLQQMILGKIEKNASADELGTVADVREKAIEHIGDALDKINDQKVLREALDESLSSNGSPFKPVRNLEVLEAVEEKVPDKAKDAINRAKENAQKRFRDQLALLPEKNTALLSDYVKEVGGNEVLYVKVFDGLKFEDVHEEGNTPQPEKTDELDKRIILAKDSAFTRLEDRLKETGDDYDTAKNTVLRKANNGTLSGLRTLENIKRNVSPDLEKVVENAKQDALDQFASNDINEADLEEESKKTPDIVQIRVLEELQEYRGRNTRPQTGTDNSDDTAHGWSKEEADTFSRVKRNVQDSIIENIRKAKSESDKEKAISQATDDSPDSVPIIETIFEYDRKVRAAVLEAQLNNIEKKIDVIPDKAKAGKIEQELHSDNIRETILRIRPQLPKETGTTSTAMPRVIRPVPKVIPPEVKVLYNSEHDPVCGTNGATYANECRAKESGATVDYKGRCIISCPREYNPVCGADEKTYSSACLAENAGVKVNYTGACKVPCSTNYVPVCGKNGVTYDNYCRAIEAGALFDYSGKCKVPCTSTVAPVCGTDGKTYNNGCLAEEAGTTIDYSGSCKETCSTTYAPVCGTDKVTYSNACIAQKSGVVVDYTGACREECSVDYVPVCGTDGVTYINECRARTIGKTVQYSGRCTAEDEVRTQRRLLY